MGKDKIMLEQCTEIECMALFMWQGAGARQPVAMPACSREAASASASLRRRGFPRLAMVALGWGGDVAARCAQPAESHVAAAASHARSRRQQRRCRGNCLGRGQCGVACGAEAGARKPVQPAETVELDVDGHDRGCPSRGGCGIARGEEASMVEPTHVGRRVHAGERRRRSSTRR
uniref:Uncharacterized protein n=2 Tax=Oryza sativa subsp. japonica TaxID=39947 RepID=Q53LT7_ORYSJ|nr:hypothetical protein LOC_Os11g16340 [Oryza sativa Japonica Group]ABA92490.1 hypothetical protein LOC_Os11g16340 [Oryza sativa Japonica Group]